MERLTMKSPVDNGVLIRQKNGDFTSYCFGCRYINRCKNQCPEVKAFKKLSDYEDAEEQGLFIQLPCKNWFDIVFGDQTIFFGIDTDYLENPIRKITIDNAERVTWYDGWRTVVLKGTDENGYDWEFSPDEVGKSVFLTKEAAEQALKEMED